MTSSKVRIGIVGAGRWAQASHLPALAKLKNIELTALSKFNPQSIDKIADRFNIKHTFSSWKKLVNSREVDAVIILSPPKTHYPIAIAAFNRKKHVLCEGPLSMNYSEAKEMLYAAENNGLIHSYVRPKLFMDGGSKVKEIIAQGTLGKIQNVLITWRPKIWLNGKVPLSWRHLISQSPPLLAAVPIIILIELLGPVDSVCADFGIHVKKRYSETNKRMMGVTAPDYFHAILKLKSGVNVVIQGGSGDTELSNSGFQICGSEKTLLWEWTLPNKILLNREGTNKVKDVSYAFDFKKQWKFDQLFVKSIREQSLPEYNFKQGVYEMKVIDAIVTSAKEKKWVKIG